MLESGDEGWEIRSRLAPSFTDLEARVVEIRAVQVTLTWQSRTQIQHLAHGRLPRVRRPVIRVEVVEDNEHVRHPQSHCVESKQSKGPSSSQPSIRHIDFSRFAISVAPLSARRQLTRAYFQIGGNLRSRRRAGRPSTTAASCCTMRRASSRGSPRAQDASIAPFAVQATPLSATRERRQR